MSTFIKGNTVPNATLYALYKKKSNNHDPNNLIYNINEPGESFVNGVKFTVLEDGSVSVHGTATKQTTFTIYRSDAFELTAGNYYLYGCPSGGSNNGYYLKLEYVADGGKNLIDTGSGANSQVSTGYSDVPLFLYIGIEAGVTVNNRLFKPLFTKTQGDVFTSAAPPNAYTKLSESTTINFEVSAMGLEAGTHTLAVKAMADGYDDSDYSNEVVYTQT
jgi:hypothetical protein